MWDNEEWARRHIAKKRPEIPPEAAWQASFGNSEAKFLLSNDQLRFPPYRRYWTIGITKSGKRLLVVWEQFKYEKNLITAYPPNEEQVKAYERKIKKK